MPSPTAERGEQDTSTRSYALVGPRFVFLWWNLFLAWVPWLLSATLRHTKRSLLFWPLLLSWLSSSAASSASTAGSW